MREVFDLRDVNAYSHFHVHGIGVPLGQEDTSLQYNITVKAHQKKKAPRRGNRETVLNGIKLSEEQSLALQLAAFLFQREMSDPRALTGVEGGQAIAKGYAEQLSEVLKLWD